jgi:ABC-type nickel/cobalt efflux system permease component RcnA
VTVIGLLALFASQFVVPNVLAPILEILLGLLVVVMGGQLIWQGWIAFRNCWSAEHDHGHTHDHSDGQVPSHLPPTEDGQHRNCNDTGRQHHPQWFSYFLGIIKAIENINWASL